MAERKPVAAVWRLLAVVAATVAFVPVGLWWLRMLDLIPEATPFVAIEYLPPSWLLAPIIPAVALLFMARARMAAGLLVFAWAAVALIRGDHGMATRPGPPLDRGAEVALLEWNVRDTPPERIAARLLEIRPDVALLAGATPRTLADLRSRLETFHVIDNAGAGGAAIVTPHRVVVSNTQELPAEAGTGRKRLHLLHAELELPGPGMKIHAVAVNFGGDRSGSMWERLGEGGRLLAARDAGCRFLSTFVARLDGPVVVGGDLDAPPSTRAVRRLAGVADDLLLAVDPWNLASLRGWQAPARNDYVFVRDLDPIRAQWRPTGPVVGAAWLPAASKRLEPGASGARRQ